MLFWHLQRQLTKNRLKLMNPGAKVVVPKVLLEACFFFFLPLKEYLFGICSMSQHLHKNWLCSCWSCCWVDGARLSSVALPLVPSEASPVFTVSLLSCFLTVFLLWDPKHLQNRAA